MSPFSDDAGTMSLLPLGVSASFRSGTSLHLGDPINADPDAMPKRVSNILFVE